MDGSSTGIKPDAPSHLHRALRWSLPGVALLSIPVSLKAVEHYLPGLAVAGRMVADFYSPAKIGISLLALLTAWTSYRALACIYEARGQQMVRMALLAVFNLFAAAAGVFTFLIAVVSLFSFGLD